MRSVPISKILLAELEGWLKFRMEVGMAKKKLRVATSLYVFCQRSLKFSLIEIQQMIKSYSLPYIIFPIST